jgi:hypothetical protein
VADLNQIAPPRARDVQEPLLTNDEMAALMPTEMPSGLPQGFASGVNEFFDLLERVADESSGKHQAVPRPAEDPLAAVFGEASVPPPAPTPASAPLVPAAPSPPAADAPARATAPASEPNDAPPSAAPERLAALPMIAELAPPERNRVSPAAVEIGILFALIVGLEVCWTGRVGSFGVHPHPYWLVVLPMAAARGLWTGLAAAALASSLYAIGVVHGLRIDDVRRLLDYQLLLEPILFAFAAFFVGQFRDDLLLRYKKLWRVLEHESEETARLAAQNHQLTARNRDYQARLLDHSAQFGNLIDIARRLELADEREILELALDMVKEHCGATRCSVVMVLAAGSGDDKIQLELVAERGWPEPTIRLHLDAAAGSSLVRKCVRESMPVSGFDPATPAPKDGPILVAPIFDQHTVLSALLCVEELPADRYSANLESMFAGVAEWTTVSLARVRSGRRAKEFTPASVAEVTEAWLGTSDELGARLRLEDARCTHQGVSTSLLTLQATELKETDAPALDALDARVRELAAGALRSSDSLYRFGYPGCWVAVLPDTPLQGARVVCQRLSRRLRMVDTGVLGAVALDAVAPDDEHPSLPSLLPVIAERFRGLSGVSLDTRCPVAVQERASIGDAIAFVRAVRIELDLAMRGDSELFVVSMRLDAQDARQRELFAQQIEQQHGRLLRAIDGLYRLADNHFAVVLPDAKNAVAFSVIGDLLELLGSRLSPAVVDTVQHEVFALAGMPGEAQRLIDKLVEHAQRMPSVPTPLAAEPAPPPEADAPALANAAATATLAPSTAPPASEAAALAAIFGSVADDAAGTDDPQAAMTWADEVAREVAVVADEVARVVADEPAPAPSQPAADPDPGDATAAERSAADAPALPAARRRSRRPRRLSRRRLRWRR